MEGGGGGLGYMGRTGELGGLPLFSGSPALLSHGACEVTDGQLLNVLVGGGGGGGA